MVYACAHTYAAFNIGVFAAMRVKLIASTSYLYASSTELIIPSTIVIKRLQNSLHMCVFHNAKVTNQSEKL
jgi:hypothetical protein